MSHGFELEREAAVLAVRDFRIGLWRATLPDGALEWDARMCALVGHPAPKHFWHWIKRFVHGHDQQALRETAAELRPGPFRLRPLRVTRADRRTVWIQVNGEVFLDDRGRPHRIVGSAMDVSETKQVQQRLAQSARLETLGHFSAGVSHNFNNMLMVIGSCLDELRTTLDGDERWSRLSGRAMGDAQDASRRAAQVVAQLANLARSGPADERARVQVSAVCSEVGRLAARAFPEQIRFRQAINANAYVECAPGAVEQVLSNVLFNARDALVEAGTPDPTVSLEVSAVELHGEQTVRMVVRDNGPGIPEAVLESSSRS